MKAYELAQLLMNVPDSEVLFASPLVNGLPMPLEQNHIAHNLEANAWVIELPSPLSSQPVFVTSPID